MSEPRHRAIMPVLCGWVGLAASERRAMPALGRVDAETEHASNRVAGTMSRATRQPGERSAGRLRLQITAADARHDAHTPRRVGTGIRTSSRRLGRQPRGTIETGRPARDAAHELPVATPRGSPVRQTPFGLRLRVAVRPDSGRHV